MTLLVRTSAAALLLAIPYSAHAQAAPLSSTFSIDTAQRYFAEARALCRADGGKLWGVSLCGPMMFVDLQTRAIVANTADTKGQLIVHGGAFTGTLPTDQNAANTAVDWSGVHWTQILWPLPNDERVRATLMMHELYHRVQDSVGVPRLQMGENAHLDDLDARFTMQLEWRALSSALKATSDAGRRRAIDDALLFRAARYRRYPKAMADERALELNEGLAEYTGVLTGNPEAGDRTKAAQRDLRTHAADATFVRSFAYATGPAYGLLLDRYAPGWRKKLGETSGFETVLGAAVHWAAPPDFSARVEARAAQYDGVTLHAAEVERDAMKQAVVAKYRALLVDGHVLAIKMQHMSVQFDPRTLQPLGDEGTVYPMIRIADDWGVLEVKNGALMKPNWSAIVVSAPAVTSGSSLRGDGWTLELKPGWKLVPGARDGDYTLAGAQ